jgi:hypothetical protein
MWGFLVFHIAFLLGNLVTLLVGFIGAFLVRNLMAVRHRDIDTVLDWDLVTDWVRNLSLILLFNILAVIIWVVPASRSIHDPFLLISSSLPMELAVFFVAGVALCLCVGLIFSSELIMALLAVAGAALLLIGCLTNLPGGGAALPLIQSLALLDIHRVADVLLGLHISGVPDCSLLCPAPYRGSRTWSSLWLRGRSSNVSILRG